jgi:NADH:ubiquinone oxidoreductase subunit 6 (subunit J)
MIVYLGAVIVFKISKYINIDSYSSFQANKTLYYWSLSIIVIELVIVILSFFIRWWLKRKMKKQFNKNG